MTTSKNAPLRFILECNDHGEVEQVLLDPHGFFEDVNLPTGLNTLVATPSHPELSSFWNNVVKSGIEEGTLLKLKLFDQESEFVCSGYRLKDKILVSCTNEVSSNGKSLQEIVRVNREQQGRLRIVEKDSFRMQNEIAEYHSDAMLNDMGALNNELITCKRELIRINTEMQKANDELKRAKENMEVLAYSVSHDLKEPVRMVKSFMSLFYLKYSSTLDETGKKYVEFAVDGASRLDDMIRDLLAFYRATANTTIERVDLNHLLDEIQEVLRLQIAERNTVIVSDRLPAIETSPVGMRHIFLNLISNAIKFVPAERHPQVSVKLIPDNDWVILSFADNGIGIPLEFQRKIFRLFKKRDENSLEKSSGMGLAIVKRIVESLGGTIWVESVEGQGSSFFLKFPK